MRRDPVVVYRRSAILAFNCKNWENHSDEREEGEESSKNNILNKYE